MDHCLQYLWLTSSIWRSVLSLLAASLSQIIYLIPRSLFVVVAKLCPTLLRPHGLWPVRLFCPWDFLGKNTGVSCHFLLQGIFPTQGSNLNLLCLLHCRQILYHRATREAPKVTSVQSSRSVVSPTLCNQSLPAWVFSNESTLRMRLPKYWSFSVSIIPSKEIPGLISFRMDWLDLLAVQETLKCLLQHHSSKASILQHSAFFTVQLLHPYMTTGKTIALTRQTFVGKVLSLLFNTLSRLVITFLPRSKCLLISWLQSPSAVILEPQKIKSDLAIVKDLYRSKHPG